ncbi:UNVERIFIED_CONTAM: hypothetical protein RMT77_006919 [Armadillidium vulgare]
MKNLYFILAILIVSAFTTYIITWIIAFSGNDGLNRSEAFELLKKESCFISPLRNIDEFFRYTSRRHGVCKHLETLGGTSSSDTSRYVCFDRKYKFQTGNCNVLSFGIGDDLLFEEDLDNFGCRVFVFDPTSSKLSLKSNSKIWLYSLGLSDFTGWKNNVGLVDTYSNIIEKALLTGRIIDYLKVDTLGSEVEFLEDVLNNSPNLLRYVKQIGIEIYLQKPPKQSIDDINQEKFHRFHSLFENMQKLECLGFKMVNTRSDIGAYPYLQNKQEENIRIEILWINKSKRKKKKALNN